MSKSLFITILTALLITSCTNDSSDSLVYRLDEEYDDDNLGEPIKEYPQKIDATIDEFFENHAGDKPYEVIDKYVYHPGAPVDDEEPPEINILYSEIWVNVNFWMVDTLYKWDFAFNADGEFLWEMEN